MCGIAGFNWSDSHLIKKMTDSIQHRGPDADGLYVNERVSLGHRRLAILDLSENGRQPMDYKKYTIVFNGEIYNFLEIKAELQKKGHTFYTSSDTEMILHAYEEWGENCVQHFNGMWAFCLYDKTKQTFFLSRDRFGIKPLYYFWNGQQFIFASELKAIRQHDLSLTLDKKALNYYLYQKYIGDNLTIFKEIRKLRPAENLLLDLKTNDFQITKYYNIDKEIEKANQIPLKKRLQLIEQYIIDGVEKRLLADVKVGSFLSGGVDSSLISGIIAENKKDFDTFSIGFKEKSFDELDFSKIVAEHIKTNHHYEYLDVDEDLIKYVIGSLDEPFGDASLLPTYLLSKITKKHVTVSLSGDAGDELFGGYDSYKAYHLAKVFPNFLIHPLRLATKLLPTSDKKLSLTYKMKKFANDFDSNVERRHLNWMSQLNEEKRQNLLNGNFLANKTLIPVQATKNLLSLQLNDVHNYLAEDILKKVDIASMLNSLEARVPFLDYRLVPLALSLPENYKIKGTETKWFLKKFSEKYIPKEIVYRKKRGFSVPIARWIKNSAFIKEVLLSEKYLAHQLFNPTYIQQLYNDHVSEKGDYSRELWLIFVFNYWWSQNN